MLQAQHMGEKLQLSTPDFYNKEHVTAMLVSTAAIQKL